VTVSRAWFSGFAAPLFVLASIGCHESSGAQPNGVGPAHTAPPPAPSGIELAPKVESPLLPSAPSASATTAPEPVRAASPDLSTVAEPNADPVLFDAQGKPLDQTDQRPMLTSPSFQKRVAAVARAITSGDVEPALSAFFPLVAYQQVKDVAKPERDYKFRLLANFKRDLLEYHHALGSAAAESKFEGITVSEKDAKWMAPGSEGNKLGYFRVLRSRLRFTLPTGRSREFELTSLISWRGEWYVVHLHGFK
jgi:hypothetical protein